MKNIIIVIISVSLICLAQTIKAQSVNLESSVIADSTKTQISIQRVEITTKFASLKYDYKAGGDDVFGIKVPKIWSNRTASLSGMVVKIGDGDSKDRFVADIWGNKQFGSLSTMLEVGRIVDKNNIPTDYAGARLSFNDLTAEFYALTYHPISTGIASKDALYGWVAYHPTHAFIAVGKQDGQDWAFLGTRNLENFGNFNFVNYQPNGNFWFKSQAGFGHINQKFFAQENYLDATSYLVVPVFFYKHFSPICVKGDYSLKFEGRRIGKTETYEMMFGKKIGDDWLRFAVGLNSEHRTNLRTSPSFELYKDWQTKSSQCIFEMRYDLLYQVFSAYLIIKY